MTGSGGGQYSREEAFCSQMILLSHKKRRKYCSVSEGGREAVQQLTDQVARCFMWKKTRMLQPNLFQSWQDLNETQPYYKQEMCETGPQWSQLVIIGLFACTDISTFLLDYNPVKQALPLFQFERRKLTMIAAQQNVKVLH